MAHSGDQTGGYSCPADQRTRIVATVGPASRDPATLRRLVASGASVFRLNMSHGSHDDHASVVRTVRALEEELGRPLTLLQDLCGPKIRLGDFPGGEIFVTAGQRLEMVCEQGPVSDGRIPLPIREAFAALKPGARVLIDDGRLTLHVDSVDGESAVVRAETDGRIADHKGVNLPDVALPISALTDKDREDLAFGLEQGVDWVALSFVQRADDLHTLRELVGDRAALVAKLEKPSAMEQLDAIVDATDAVMIARGDLGVEIPPEDVPVAQRRIVRRCRVVGKPVIVATQMLDSMMGAPRPTRAEASDVANAVYEGVDAVMLSGETAAGDYPVEAVEMMARIIARVEADEQFRNSLDAGHPQPSATDADAICCAVRRIAQILPTACCVTWTESGFTTLRVARERPMRPILSLTPSAATARRIALAWGVVSRVVPDAADGEAAAEAAARAARDNGIAAPGDALVMTAGLPFGVRGTTNQLRIVRA